MSQLIDSKQIRQQNQYGGHESADGFKEKTTTKPIFLVMSQLIDSKQR